MTWMIWLQADEGPLWHDWGSQNWEMDRPTWLHIAIKLINEWTNKWMNEWMNKWMNEWMNEWMKKMKQCKKSPINIVLMNFTNWLTKKTALKCLDFGFFNHLRRFRLSKWAHQGVLSLHIYFHFALLHLRMVAEWIIRHLIRKGD